MNLIPSEMTPAERLLEALWLDYVQARDAYSYLPHNTPPHVRMAAQTLWLKRQAAYYTLAARHPQARTL